MFQRRPRPSKLSTSTAVLFLMAVALLAAMPRFAAAAIVSCRADPIVTLSNGKVVQMTAFMETDAANVKLITYTLRAPKGTTVVNVAYTGGELASKEKFVFYADRNSNNYGTETVVTTETAGVRVSAQTRIGGESATISGLSGERLLAYFRVN